MSRSHWLVALQLLLIAAIGLLALAGIVERVSARDLSAQSLLALIAIALAAALALWALASMPGGTFRVMPEPSDSGQLATDGPYRRIRHPMYSSVLLGCAGLVALSSAILLALPAWLALTAVLLLKIRHEERLLSQRYANYAGYASTTWRLLPGIW